MKHKNELLVWRCDFQCTARMMQFIVFQPAHGLPKPIGANRAGQKPPQPYPPIPIDVLQLQVWKQTSARNIEICKRNVTGTEEKKISYAYDRKCRGERDAATIAKASSWIRSPEKWSRRTDKKSAKWGRWELQTTTREHLQVNKWLREKNNANPNVRPSPNKGPKAEMKMETFGKWVEIINAMKSISIAVVIQYRKNVREGKVEQDCTLPYFFSFLTETRKEQKETHWKTDLCVRHGMHAHGNWSSTNRQIGTTIRNPV